jgi:putative DNA primase/helicase
MALQVQEPPCASFFDKIRGAGAWHRLPCPFSGGLAGINPRQRQIDPKPRTARNWPHLAAFHRRIAAILEQPVPIDEDGALTPALLTLAPDAKAAWVEFHNAIESELASGGELLRRAGRGEQDRGQRGTAGGAVPDVRARHGRCGRPGCLRAAQA